MGKKQILCVDRKPKTAVEELSNDYYLKNYAYSAPLLFGFLYQNQTFQKAVEIFNFQTSVLFIGQAEPTKPAVCVSVIAQNQILTESTPQESQKVLLQK